MSSRPVREVELNLPQLAAAMAGVPSLWLEWGRGSGKSTALGLFAKELALGMPRGKFFLSGNNYRQLLGTTLPSTIHGLEMFGLYRDVHYFVGHRAARKLGWPDPYEPPLDYTACLHFFTGTVLQLVSQDRNSVGSRGQNWDGGMADEVALQDETRFYEDCQAGNRTNRRAFLEHPLYHCEILASSTPVTRTGLWFLKGEEIARRNPKRAAFIRADARHNAHNLRPGWFRDMREKMPSLAQYRAEVLNIRPRLTVDAFYPALQGSRHYYSATDGDFYLHRFANRTTLAADSRADLDVDPDQPLILSIDPGARINSMVVDQLHGLELRTVKEFWRLNPSILQDMLQQDFLPYYQHHRRKVVELFYDRTANASQPDSRRTLAEKVVEILRAGGWAVNMRSLGAAVVLQDEKHHLVNTCLDEKDPRLPRVRINRDNCPALVVSLEMAEAMENSKGRIQKDKRSERRAGPQQHATHLSDAWDLPLVYYATAAIRRHRIGSQATGATMVG